MKSKESVVPELSVILATYNRADVLPRTLGHLADQSLDAEKYEVIVIDDGSPDNTRQIVEELQATMPFAMKYLHHSNKGPGYTINRGIREARAPLLLLMADDILLSRNSLLDHVTEHRENPEQEVALLGAILQSPELDETVFLQNWDPFGFQDLEGVRELPYYKFWACNISVKTDFMTKYGMFRDPKGRAGAPAHEDVEVGYRLSKHGLRVLLSRRNHGYHYHRYTLDQAIKRYHDRGLNWGEFLAHVPDPELIVAHHDLSWNTLGDHIRVLKGENTLHGSDKSLLWHIVRHFARLVILNRVTVRFFWDPLLRRAEKSPFIARFMSRQLYRAFLYYHFTRGIADARLQYDTAVNTPV